MFLLSKRHLKWMFLNLWHLTNLFISLQKLQFLEWPLEAGCKTESTPASQTLEEKNKYAYSLKQIANFILCDIFKESDFFLSFY